MNIEQPKRAYQAPEVIDLGQMEELTKSFNPCGGNGNGNGNNNWGQGPQFACGRS
jgi:hypothetical protein